MEEKYKVVLEATIDKFRTTIDKATNMMRDFGNKAKKDFRVGFDLDKAQTTKDLDFLKNKVKESVAIVKKEFKEIENLKLDLSELYKKQDSGLYKGVARGELDSEVQHKESLLKELSKQVDIDTQSVRNYSDAYNDLEKDLQQSNTIFGRIGSAIRKVMEAPKEAMQSLKETGKDTIDTLHQTNEELNEMGGSSGRASGGISKAFTKATKSLKRFALSLFGIRSIWALLSRGLRSYMADNKELSNTMKGVWKAVGTLLAPVAEVLANIFLKLLGYINVVTVALWNYDFVAEANKKTMEEYTKSVLKAQKALSGFDELNNLQQNEDEGPQGLITIPPLNEGIVKGLQNMSEALKDNWDWIKKVLEVLALFIGISAVAGWLKNIGALLGFGTAGVAGGAGLIGMACTLAAIVGFLALLPTLIDNVEWAEVYGWDKSENKQVVDDAKDYVEDAGKEDYKSKQKMANLLSKLRFDKSRLKSVEEAMPKGVIDNWLDFFSGKTTKLYAEKDMVEESIKDITDAFVDLGRRGELTEDQIKQFNEAMEETVFKMDSFGNIYYKNKGSFELIYKGFSNANTATKDFNNEIDKTPTKVQNAFSNINDLVKNPFKIVLQTILKEPTQDNVNNLVNSVMNMVKTGQLSLSTLFGNGKAGSMIQMAKDMGIYDMIKTPINQMIDAFNNSVMRLFPGLPKIPRLSIGTDKVMSEGLAYLHRGEKVVPADVASGGFSGNNDETNALLRELIQTLDDKQFTANIGEDAVGRASVNYIRNQNRLMGGSVI